MAKAEWGLKRSCQSCGARFYDLRKSPIVCPKCGAEFDPQVLLRPQRSRPAPVEVPVPVAAAIDDVEIDEDAEIVDDAAEDEEEEVIEDASELGEDKDDMFEVIEKVEGEDER